VGHYIDIEDLKSRLGENLLKELTDNERLGKVGEKRANSAITYAEGIVNGYIGSRYVVPSAVNEFLKAITQDVAVYDLIKEHADFKEGRFEVHQLAYDRAIKLLEAISRGRMLLEGGVLIATESRPGPRRRTASSVGSKAGW
jgi:phage gp36-like protein